MRTVLPAIACLCLVSAAFAQSMPGHYLWGEGRSYGTVSPTAQMITGPIAIRGARLVFDGGKSLQLAPVGPTRGVWSSSELRQTADVFRIGADPGPLRNGKTLCRRPARYVAFYETGGLPPALEAAFFDSAQPPRGIASHGLCETFSYAAQ